MGAIPQCIRADSHVRHSQFMTGAPMCDRLTVDAQVMGGRACIRGLRICASLVVNLVTNGMSSVTILAEYPDLEADDVYQALRYALARFR
jgi:uncharacterized protein (DUF433 family)